MASTYNVAPNKKKKVAYGTILPGSTSSGLGQYGPPAPAPSAPAWTSGGSASNIVHYGESRPTVHDPIYNAAASGINQSTGNAEGDFQYGLTSGQSKYGFKATPGADGKTYTFSELDPSDPLYNPFSELQLLKKHFEQTKTGNLNSYADSGQGYAGSLQNAQDKAGSDYTQGYGGLQTGFQDYLHGITSTRDNAYAAGTTALGTAGAEEVQRHAGDAPAPIILDAAAAEAQHYLAPGVHLGTGWKIVVDPVTGFPIKFLKPGESL